MIYRNGSRHGIAEYSQVVLRSNTAIAYNKGTLLEGKEQGMKYAIAYDGPECGLTSHQDGRKANNLILPIGQAMQHLISHAQCRRSWGPVPDIASKKQAQAAMAEATYATTAAQDSAQRTADALTRGQNGSLRIDELENAPCSKAGESKLLIWLNPPRS